ncbi:MAG TPA: MOSC domain-containing protein [Anaerolineae bacterium]|nr:MOSC domain-containing protein [Anaerolineae bacterium]MCB0225082.1 MOSC domain-containing protein [Anaerolineae bacterium]HRV95027.1 MOSC domain-containing protein [Anaerolineae bacterium]
MKLISINVGQPREVEWHGQKVTTGIFKEPVAGPVMVRMLNLDGDKQADLSVHGGVDKAVYAYPTEHYDYWHGELPDMNLPWGMFGENLTIEGLVEAEVNIGDHFRLGSAELVATQPRLPCFKLGLKFGRDDMVKRFLASRRTGVYFKVVREGQIQIGDELELLRRDGTEVTIADITRLFAFEKDDLTTLQKAVQVRDLPDGWRDYFQQQIDKRS